MRSLSSRTSWAPTSNAQPNLLTPAGGVCHGRHPLRQLGTFLMCRHLGTLLTQPRNALLATEFWGPHHPERCFQAHTRSKQPKIALFEPAPRGRGQKGANMSTVTILVAGKTPQKTSKRPLQPPKAANLTGLRRIGANFNEHIICYVHYLLGCKCYSISNSTHIWYFLPTAI